MRRVLILAVLSISIAGCADRTVERLTSPTVVKNLEIPTDGDPTYYSTNVNTTYYGGYSGYDNPDAARSAVYTEEFIWSSSSNFWDIQESFSPNYGPFGAESAGERGVSRTVRTRSDLVAYNRSGQVIYQPNTSLALNSAPPDASASIMIQPTVPISMNQSVSGAANSSKVPENVPGREALDSRVVTPAAAARALAQLRKTATEISSGPDKMDFEIRRGDSRSLLTFTRAYGAVTRARVEDADGTIAETDYQYSPVRGGFVLTGERTTIRLPNVTQPLVIDRKYSDTSIR